MSNWKVGHFEHWFAHFDLLSRSAPNLDVFFENLLSTLLKLSARLIVVFILPQKWTSIFPAGAHQSINSCRAFHLRHTSSFDHPVRSGIFGIHPLRQHCGGRFSFCRDAHNACVPLSVHVCTQHGVNTWPPAMKCSPLPFSSDFLPALVAVIRLSELPGRFWLRCLKRWAGPRAITSAQFFPSPHAISGHILQMSTRASNISNEIHLIGWKGLTQLSKHPEHCGWWLFFSGIYKSFLIASVWRPSSAGLCGWGHVRCRNSSGPFGCTSRPV